MRAGIDYSRGARARLAAFGKQSRGAVSVEFAFVAPLLFLVLIFPIAMGYTSVLSHALNYGTVQVARQIATGQVQAAQLSQAQFITNVVCPALPAMFTCNNVIVNLQPVPATDPAFPNEYYGFLNAPATGLNVPPLSNTQTTFCPGNAESYVYLQIIYPIPHFLSAIMNMVSTNTFAGANVSILMSTATFLNEPFVAPVSPC